MLIIGHLWAFALPVSVLGQQGPMVDSILDKQADKVASSIAEKVSSRANEKMQAAIVEQTNDAVLQQASETLSEKTTGNIAEQARENVGQQTSEAVQARVQETAEQRLDVGNAVSSNGLNGLEQAQERAGGVAQGLDVAAQAIERAAQSMMPGQLPVTAADGQELFVEIAIDDEFRAIASEWVLLIDADQRGLLENQAPTMMAYLTESRDLATTGKQILVFSLPPDIDNQSAVEALLPPAFTGLIDRNHLYATQQETAGADVELADTSGEVGAVNCPAPVSLGIIDSAINLEHPAFREIVSRKGLQVRRFIADDLQESTDHGTAVVGRLVGTGESMDPLLPDASVYSAAVVYTQGEYHQSATVIDILEAMDWMLAQPDVRVVNISLAGPPNRLLEQQVNALSDRGLLLVAAAGNAGPHAPPRFPAAYEKVIGVTATDRQRRVFPLANRGYIDFAAEGVDVLTALGDGSYGRESGTSMAAPVVAAMLACALSDRAPEHALQQLRQQAVDLGEQGFDPVYGHGLLHPGLAKTP